MRTLISLLQISVALLAALAILLLDIRWIAAGVVAVALVIWLTRPGRPILLLLRSALTLLLQRQAAALVIMVGVGAVCATYVGMRSVGTGLDGIMQSTGDDATAIILKQGARTEADSSLSRDVVSRIVSADGVARTASGEGVASQELAITAEDLKGRHLHVRGVSALANLVYASSHLIEGRMFRSGVHELVAGANLSGQFDGDPIGATVTINGEPWRIVGVLRSGDAHDAELWGDSVTLASAFGRNDYQDVVVRLNGAQGLSTLTAWARANSRLNLEVDSTRHFYASQSKVFTQVIRIFSVCIAILLGLGAFFAVLNTMFTVAEERMCEMSTLRAIGFSSIGVVVAFCIEGALLALAGGVMTVGFVWLALSGHVFSTAGAGFTQIAFVFHLDPSAVLASARIALALGIVGSAVPGIVFLNRELVSGLRYT
ncbi:ABC transporter permease [Dyella monticola]|uniref:ABC transporter permease n=1 Tax=Dyella monticola TaxID=1927958 RepID=A0A370X3G3_9GAMM|nr:ABC transporter permease [Dyella monticola]RDS82765.1 ABC transporter permease [Dyella monticola]